MSATGSLASLLRGAAGMLEGAPGAGPAAAGLLHRLDLAASGPDAADAARLLRLAADLDRLFVLAAAAAPGMVAVGGELTVAGTRYAVSGCGLTQGEAFRRCAGEAAELLSQRDSTGRVIGHPPGPLPGGMAAMLAALDATPDAWLPARRLADGAPAWVPAALCIRGDPGWGMAFDWPLSQGCGVGPDPDQATLHGLLELVERDAVALWWHGAHPARALPLGGAMQAAADLLGQLRRSAEGRPTWLLDVTSDLGIPVAVAVSTGADGVGFCCGMAAAPVLAGAACKAVLELCQMELAQEIAADKRAAPGDSALGAADLRHLRRREWRDPDRLPQLRAAPPPANATPPGPALADLVARLAHHGFDPCVVTRPVTPYGIPAARVLCPGLQPGPDSRALPGLRGPAPGALPYCLTAIPLL